MTRSSATTTSSRSTKVDGLCDTIAQATTEGGVTNATLTALIHGGAGAGKSRLCDTAPGPRLILDAEGRAHYLPSGPKVYWDPISQAPPLFPENGEWTTCVVVVHSMQVLTSVYVWLRSGQHPFKSVLVDSLMEIQKRVIDEVAGVNQLTTPDWGTLLRRLEHLVRSYRDLTMLTDNSVEVVVFTVGSADYDGKYEPLLQGALRKTLPYYFDVVGYLYVTVDEAGESTRHLLVHNHPNFVAKDGTGLLPGPTITAPNLESIVNILQLSQGELSTTEGSI